MGRDVYDLVTATIADQMKQKGLEVPGLERSTRLLGGDLPLDSLDLAAILVELQTHFDSDPFASGFINFETVGELVQIYEKAPS